MSSSSLFRALGLAPELAQPIGSYILENVEDLDTNPVGLYYRLLRFSPDLKQDLPLTYSSSLLGTGLKHYCEVRLGEHQFLGEGTTKQWAKMEVFRQLVRALIPAERRDYNEFNRLTELAHQLSAELWTARGSSSHEFTIAVPQLKNMEIFDLFFPEVNLLEKYAAITEEPDHHFFRTFTSMPYFTHREKRVAATLAELQSAFVQPQEAMEFRHLRVQLNRLTHAFNAAVQELRRLMEELLKFHGGRSSSVSCLSVITPLGVALEWNVRSSDETSTSTIMDLTTGRRT
jgi:hypothetical protein